MRCSICPAKTRCVPGDGPKPARVMCVGEAPGREEDAKGVPFIGQAGMEFNRNYLNLAGLYRDEVYVTNTVHCRPDQNRKPSAKEAAGCAGYWMPQELCEVQPEICVLMGATACSLVPGIDLEAEHGIPQKARVFEWEGWVVPMYHPAAGLHDTSLMTPLLEDWETLGRWLETGKWQWACEDAPKDYGLLETKVQFEEFVHKYPNWDWIGGDTESHSTMPYSWQVSPADHVARMIMLRDYEASLELARWLRRALGRGSKLIFHYAQADLPIFENEIGWGIDGCYRDTMLEAYGFGNLGRLGLKTLARRVLGRKRLSWEETVGPPSKLVLGAWCAQACEYVEREWTQTVERVSEKTGKLLKPKVVKDPAQRVLTDVLRHMTDSEEYDAWERLEERLGREVRERLERELGAQVPVKGIAHASVEDQIQYACADPDDTRRLALKFEQMRKEVVRVEEGDRDI